MRAAAFYLCFGGFLLAYSALAQPSPQIDILSLSCVIGEVGPEVQGQAQNNSGGSIQYLDMSAVFKDADGKFVSTDDINADYHPVLSGQTTPFDGFGGANPVIASVEITPAMMDGGALSFNGTNHVKCGQPGDPDDSVESPTLPPEQPAPAASLPPQGSSPPPPASITPIPAAVADYNQGQVDRQAWESWFAALSGAEQQGANFWAGQRSLPQPRNCVEGSEDAFSDNAVSQTAFESGCQEATTRLAASDLKRKIDPLYRAGWNAPLPAADGESQETTTGGPPASGNGQ